MLTIQLCGKSGFGVLQVWTHLKCEKCVVVPTSLQCVFIVVASRDCACVLDALLDVTTGQF